jgi:oligopeptidase A
MSNPLLVSSVLPAFDTINLSDFNPAVESLINDAKRVIDASLGNQIYSWENFVEPISVASTKIDYVWALLSQLKSVKDSEELRELYQGLSGKVTQFYTELAQSEPLFGAYSYVAEHEQGLDEAQIKMLENTLRSFRLNGVALASDKKQELAELKQSLVSLTNRFSENVLDATQAWTKHVADAQELGGLPESTLAMLRNKAQKKGFEQGYMLDLELPTYLPVMQLCDNRSFRRELYEAYITRASDQGPDAGKWDNSEVIRTILQQRKRMSNLLGFDNYADLSLETKMAESPRHVLDFLQELVGRCRPLAEKELAHARAYAAESLGIDDLATWDMPYVSEHMRRKLFNVDQEALRPYFPLPKVMAGLFEVVSSLFGVSVDLVPDVVGMHEDMQCYVIRQDGQDLAFLFMDLYAREGKRGGAWLASCKKRARSLAGDLTLPVGFLVCNFSAPTADVPSLLTHNDMTTLFHEFGHSLHYCLTQVEQPEVSGIAGVPWDAVELPSQFLENWCWQKDILINMSGHYLSGESLPEDAANSLLNAKTFQAGIQTLRQLEFALFDFRLHHEYAEGQTDVLALLQDVQSEVALLPVPEFGRFSHGFTHIFAGGYAAGYYSYKWAEVLAADAFSAFLEEGVMNRETGERFKREILEVGGARDVNQMFFAFRGREPKIDALLQQMGTSI